MSAPALALWKVVLNDRADPNEGESGSTCWEIWVAASGREIAINAARARVAGYLSALDDPLAIELGGIRIVSEVGAGRADGEICRATMSTGRHA